MRSTLAVVTKRNLTVVLAVIPDQPNMRVALVLFRINSRDNICDPLPIRGNLRIAHIAKAREIVEP